MIVEFNVEGPAKQRWERGKFEDLGIPESVNPQRSKGPTTLLRKFRAREHVRLCQCVVIYSVPPKIES